jgi:hypothetical protein
MPTKNRKKATNKTEVHKQICTQLNLIYARKNHDYGDSFGETYRKLGIISAITRITDKLNRLTSLCTTKTRLVVDETLEDTLLDMANYCIMTAIELRENK